MDFINTSELNELNVIKKAYLLGNTVFSNLYNIQKHKPQKKGCKKYKQIRGSSLHNLNTDAIIAIPIGWWPISEKSKLDKIPSIANS